MKALYCSSTPDAVESLESRLGGLASELICQFVDDHVCPDCGSFIPDIALGCIACRECKECGVPIHGPGECPICELAERMRICSLTEPNDFDEIRFATAYSTTEASHTGDRDQGVQHVH